MAWLSGYSKRKKITLTGGASGAQTDYQLKLAVSYAAAMQGDFDDLRFTQADGTTLIDAWAEVIVTDTSATVWAEFPTTPANTVEQDYYMYYGNAGAASDWKGAQTFYFFDDFDGTTLNPESSDATVANDSGKYEAWPGITKTSNGDMFVAYRTCDSNTHGVESTGRAVVRKSTDDGQTWGAEVIVANESGKDDRVTCNLLAFDYSGTERIICCYHVDNMAGEAISYCVYSDDHGVNWSSRKLIYGDATHEGHVAGQTILTSQDKLLVPVCVDKDASWGEAVFESSDGGDNWTRYNVIAANSGRNEFAIIETKTTGNYTGGVYAIFRRNDGTQYDYATSADYGHTWSALAQEADMPVTLATPCFLFRTGTDSIAAAYTNSDDMRIYESTDECGTFVYKSIAVETLSTSYYPAIERISDDELIIVWCTNAATSDVYVNFIEYPLPVAWTINTGNPAVDGGYVKLTDTDRIQSVNAFPTDRSVRMKLKFVTSVATVLCGFADGYGDHYEVAWHRTGSTEETATRHGGTEEDNAYNYLIDEKIYDVHRNGASSVVFKRDDTTLFTHTTQIPTGDMKPYLYTSASDETWCDWIFVRKYVANPATYAFGNEEDVPSGSPHWYYEMLRRRNR